VIIASRMRRNRRSNAPGSEVSAPAAPAPVAASSQATSPAGPGSRGASRESYYVVAPPSKVRGRPMGWYSVEGNLADERFWDGNTWTARRRLINDSWSPVALETGEFDGTPPRVAQLAQQPRWGP
jgi:hypothetical protein